MKMPSMVTWKRGLTPYFPQRSIDKFFEWFNVAEVVLSEIEITDDRPWLAWHGSFCSHKRRSSPCTVCTSRCIVASGACLNTLACMDENFWFSKAKLCEKRPLWDRKRHYQANFGGFPFGCARLLWWDHCMLSYECNRQLSRVNQVPSQQNQTTRRCCQYIGQ